MGPERSPEASVSAATLIIAFGIAIAAGAFGSVLGIGGGLFIVPSLTLFLGVELKTAIAASIVAVIATSLGAGNVYVRNRVANLQVGLLLALATGPGAIAGAILASRVNARILAGLFALILTSSMVQMLLSGRTRRASTARDRAASPGRLTIPGSYFEEATSTRVDYVARRLPLGVGVSTVAGLVSGLLGVGGGIIQVPVMNGLMGIPLKVATTTSTYVIGITAMAGALVYYNHRPSFVDPGLAVPVTLGVFLGASIGSRILGRIHPQALRLAFLAVLAIYTVQMALRFIGVG